MSGREDGGPAFPEAYWATPESDEPSYRSGMSLRDWFAGQALAGILAFPGAVDGNREKSKGFVAKAAYTYADALLAERSKP